MIELPSGHNLNGDLSFTQERPHNLPVHLANDIDWEWIKCDKLDDRIKRGRQHVKDWLSGKYKGAVNGA